jgi:cation diffusion facilitator family transporter
MSVLKNQNFNLQLLAVSIGALLLVGKFFAWWVTHSSTVLTDALESIINVVAGALGLYSLYLSAHPKDENHPYGHGKVEFISAGVEGTLISLAGLLIIGQAIFSLFFGTASIEKVDIGIYIASIAGAVNYFLGYLTEKQGHKTGSLAMIAGGQHLKSDAYSTIGMVIGLVLIYLLQSVWEMDQAARIIDNAVAVVFGCLIVWTGYGILRKSVAGIMDEVDYELVKNILKHLNDHRTENRIDVHNLRIIKYGPSLHIDCHLTVPWYFNTRDAHEEVDALELLLKDCIDSSVEVFVHVDPCIPNSCQLCEKNNCHVRMHEFNSRIEWTADMIMKNKKHGLYHLD